MIIAPNWPLHTKKAVWWQALNPAIYLVSILPAIGVILLTDDAIWLTGVIIAMIAVVLLQHAINLFNDVSDWRLGADEFKYDSWVRLYDGNTRIVNQHAVVSVVIGMLLGLLVLGLSGKYWILLIAAPLILLGYSYNAGSKPLSYTALGEWVTGLCYGPGVFGCLYMLTNDELGPSVILGSLTFACLAMALLLSHQPPQIATDQQAGKQSFAVRYGKDATISTVRYLLMTALVAFAAALWLTGNQSTAFLFIPMAVAVIIISYRITPNPKILLLSTSAVFVITLVFYKSGMPGIISG